MTADLPQLRRGRAVAPLTTVLLVVGAAMLAASGIVHLYLWGKSDGYRAVKTIGPLFLAQGISGCVLAVAVTVLRRPILALAGAGFMAASIAGLYKSIHGGMFGYNETWGAPWVKFSIVVELIGLAVFAVAVVLFLQRSRAAR